MDRQVTSGRDARLAALVRRQAGALSFAQARELGLSSSTIVRRVQRGAWDRRLPGVYVVAGSERTWRQDLWVGVLAVGPAAVVTHESAAVTHGAEGLPVRPVTLTNPHRWHHRLRGLVVHQIDDLGPDDRTTWGGLPVSRPARCVVELGATQPPAVVGGVLDDLLRLRRTRLSDVSVAFSRVARPGKPGMLTIARVLEERADGEPPADSELERALWTTLVSGGLPRPARQRALPGREVGGIRGLVDGAYLDAQLILEADGRSWHQRVEAARADRRRDAQAARVGWQTLRFVYEQIVHDPAFVCAAVADTRAVRLRQLHPSAA